MRKSCEIYTPSAEEEAEWEKWVAERPDVVREVAERFKPWYLYRLKTTGQRVTVVSIFEDGTICVSVMPKYNHVPAEFEVFGIDPDDLEPCDVPSLKDIINGK